MSGFRFPLKEEFTPPTVGEQMSTPLQVRHTRPPRAPTLANACEHPSDRSRAQSVTNKYANKENEANVSLAHKLCMAPADMYPVTPDLFKKPLRVVRNSPPASDDDLPTALDLVSWKNPAASFCALVGGEALLFAAHWSFGLGNATFISGEGPEMGLSGGVGV